VTPLIWIAAKLLEEEAGRTFPRVGCRPISMAWGIALPLPGKIIRAVPLGSNWMTIEKWYWPLFRALPKGQSKGVALAQADVPRR